LQILFYFVHSSPFPNALTSCHALAYARQVNRKFKKKERKPIITECEKTIAHQILDIHFLSVTVVYSIQQSNAFFSQFIVFWQIKHGRITLHAYIVKVLPGTRLVRLRFHEILVFGKADDWAIEQSRTGQSLVLRRNITGV
jgi:hypothetical protein